MWHDFYQFWVTQQTLPGNILGDVLIAGGAIIIGKFKVGPWLRKMHEQRERHHQELLASHQRLLDSHTKLRESHEKLLKSHQELIDVQRQAFGLAAEADVAQEETADAIEHLAQTNETVIDHLTHGEG